MDMELRLYGNVISIVTVQSRLYPQFVLAFHFNDGFGPSRLTELEFDDMVECGRTEPLFRLPFHSCCRTVGEFLGGDTHQLFLPLTPQ